MPNWIVDHCSGAGDTPSARNTDTVHTLTVTSPGPADVAVAVTGCDSSCTSTGPPASRRSPNSKSTT